MTGLGFTPDCAITGSKKEGATHFKEIMIPLFVQKRKNFVCGKIRLGLFLDLCFTPVLKQHKNLNVENRTGFQFWKTVYTFENKSEGSRFCLAGFEVK